MGFNKDMDYIFDKNKYFDYVKKNNGKITSIEKSFGKKYDGKRVKVVDEKSGLVDEKFYVNYLWCQKIN